MLTKATNSSPNFQISKLPNQHARKQGQKFNCGSYIQLCLENYNVCGAIKKQKKFVLATQLLKSGTSVGANVREAQNAESKTDFIHKMKIAAKEADETEYWLLLCKQSEDYPECEDLIQDCGSIIRVLSKIISSSKTNPH
jgi:four helix bundle protein